MGFANFFSRLQEAPWYREFLSPVMDTIEAESYLLDVGTGSGKMLEILYKEKKVTSIGIDTNKDMLTEARAKLRDTPVELRLIETDEPLDFDAKTFDYVSICSVLFHMKKLAIDKMLEESLNMLKPGGKVIILTPTGAGNVLRLSKHYISYRNKGIYTWYKATKNRAQKWTSENYLKQFSSQRNLRYQRDVVMNGFAQLEIISK